VLKGTYSFGQSVADSLESPSPAASIKESNQVKHYFWLLVTGMVFVAGCSSTPHRRSDAAAVFRACVHPDQSKQFSYRKGRPLKIEQKVMMQRMAEERAMQGRSRVSIADRYDKEPGEGPLYDELAELMETRQFCKEGYFELDSSFEHGYERIIGECNDSATEQEMKKLPVCGPADQL
jgi:hypothetical protein